MSEIKAGSIINIHADADGYMTCTLCGHYRNRMTWAVVYDADGVVQHNSDDFDDDLCHTTPVCSQCALKFAHGVLQEQ
jgi:outer membrane cobalamin receptor